MLASLLRARRLAAAADSARRRLSRPVVSVGNLSVGGRGKSPVAGLVARLLVAAGERPAILSRGYGRLRPEPGVTVVSDGQRVLADVATAGDEPLMLARQVPGAIVCVAEDRALAGLLAESHLGATVHVLDDGFQHHRLARCVDLVLLTDTDVTDRLLPFGRLREPLDVLRYAARQLGVLVDGETTPAIGRPVFVGRLRRRTRWPAGVAPGAPVVAVCGIAEPRRFSAALTDIGVTVSEALTFGDHHAYSAADRRRIADAVRRMSATAIVTTEKDLTRLEGAAWPVPLVAAPLEIDVDPAPAFRDWLLAALREDVA